MENIYLQSNITYEDVSKLIKNSLISISIYIDDDSEDVNLMTYGIDSITFISFILDLEEKFDINFPDEMLRFDILSSLHGFTELIYELVSQRGKR